MIFEQGKVSDINELECLYCDLIDYLESHINYPGWIKGIYPVRETAAEAIASSSLYIIRKAGRIIASAILNHEPEAAYHNVDWHTQMNYDDIFVIHTFVVHPDYLNQGIGSILMNFLIEHSIRMNIRAIRLDVYEKNQPAIQLYHRCGFQYIDTISLGYECYGLDYYKLYQKLL